MAKGNVFAKAKKTPTTAAKKDDKPVVVIEGKEFSKNLARFNELKRLKAIQDAEMKTLEGDLKGEGVEAFVDLYDKNKRNPGSFKLKSEAGDKIMVIAMDRYIKVDEDRVDELNEMYPDIVDENTVFSFNGDLLNEFQEQISDMIMNADFLSEDQKGSLIVANTTYAIKKGAINEAMTLGKGEVVDYLGEIQPVMQLKQTK